MTKEDKLVCMRALEMLAKHHEYEGVERSCQPDNDYEDRCFQHRLQGKMVRARITKLKKEWKL